MNSRSLHPVCGIRFSLFSGIKFSLQSLITSGFVPGLPSINPYALANETAPKPVCRLGKKQNTEKPSQNRPFRELIFPQNRYAPVISFAACFSMPLLPNCNRVYFLFVTPMIWMSWMLLEVFHNSFAACFIFPTKIFRLLEIPFYRTYHPLHY